LQILLFYSQIMASLLSKIFYQQVLVAFWYPDLVK
jgi:hypothetical protein